MINTGMETGLGDEWIRFGATSEHTVDGSFSERTMAISRPYIGISPPYKGNVTEKQDDLDAWADKRQSRRHPDELPRQWRCRDRSCADGLRKGAEGVSPRRCAAQDHPLQPDQ